MTMSAESPHKSSSRGSHVVAPQPVSDRSIIESVAGFINEVVPQAYTSLPPGEGKEAITWARFEYGDINDPALYPDTVDDQNCTPPLLLVLGYGCGVQVWSIPANGDATEVLSWRQGVVRTLRVLPTPLADSPVPDAFAHKRPIVALCDSAGPGPQFCSLSFISLRCGDQVKSIKFKNPINDVLANRHSVVVTFSERIAVFDACTLEDRLTVTTCYPCPGPNPNPVTLGSRWLAYAERQLLHSRRSSGGSEGEGVQSYTATVLHAAKSLGKGLRELGETVASSLTGTGTAGIQRIPVGVTGNPSTATLNTVTDALQPGVVSILDAQGVSSARGDDSGPVTSNIDLMVAHFAAHNEPIVALQFDPSGMLLLTADKRGHDFHIFRIQPHPSGSSLAAVHHLYVLHRGDTTAKVQDVAFAADSRWVAVSTLRGTTHVFPITPYGGPVGIRTHTTPHVVNRLSRFHRSAGLTADGRNSPVPTVGSSSSPGSYESTVIPLAMPYPNPRLPPYPHPIVINPLAQIRQPITQVLSGMTPISPSVFTQQPYHRNPSSRMVGRSQSLSDDGSSASGLPLRVTACFAAPRAWLVSSPTVSRESSTKMRKRSIDSLFVMACHGSLIQYDLEPKHLAGIPKEKICDDTAIELEVKAKAQWLLLRPPHSSDLQPPLPASNPLMVLPDHLPPTSESRPEDIDERWLSQVEIVTHAGPHRRLWMGPQFTFKTYTNSSIGTPTSLLEMEAVEIGTSVGSRPARSNPVNMPLSGRPVVPVLIESGSASSYEQSPRLIDAYGTDADSDGSAGPGDTQLREDLADAMMESPGMPMRDTGRRSVFSIHGKKSTFPVEKVVNPVGTVITVAVQSDEEAGGPPSPAANTRDCERVLPADIGKVNVNLVRCQSPLHNPEADKLSELELTQTTNRSIKSKSQSIPNTFSSDIHQNIKTSPRMFSKDSESLLSIPSGNLNECTRGCDITFDKQDKSAKLNQHFNQEGSKCPNDDFSYGKTSNVCDTEHYNLGQSVIQLTSRKGTVPLKGSYACGSFYDLPEADSSFIVKMKNETHLKKSLENHSVGGEVFKGDSSHDVLTSEEKSSVRKNKRGNGRKKIDTFKNFDLGCKVSSSCEKQSTEEVNAECSENVVSVETKFEEHLLSFADIARNKSSVIVNNEKCSNLGIKKVEGSELSNLELVEEEYSSKSCSKINRKKFLPKIEKPCLGSETSTSFTVTLKPKIHFDKSGIDTYTGVKNSKEETESSSNVELNIFEECSDIIAYEMSSETAQHFCPRKDENVLKSWSTIVLSSPKVNSSPKTAVDSSKPNYDVNDTVVSTAHLLSCIDVEATTSASVDKGPITWNQCEDSSLAKEDTRNNNQLDRKSNQNQDGGSPLFAPQRSWSSVVTSPKPGTSSSADEGSGGYDSNESSKDSTDVASNVFNDKTEVEDETENICKSSNNCDSNVLEDEVSDDIKIVNEDDIAVDSSLTTGSSKRNRRTKKKRR